MISTEEYDQLIEFETIIKSYFSRIDSYQFANRIVTIIIGISGTWWLWYYGMLDLVNNAKGELLLAAFVSIPIILYVANSVPDLGITRRIWLLRFYVIYYIFQLSKREQTILYSLALFALAVIYQDLLGILIKRIRRTQRFLGVSKTDLQMFGLIKSNFEYLNDRYNWLNFTALLMIAITLVSLALIQIISLLTSFNPEVIQYITLISFVGLVVFTVPKLFPPVKIKDRYSLDEE